MEQPRHDPASTPLALWLAFQFPERHFLGLTVGQELRLGHRRLSSDQQQSVLAQVGLGGLNLQQALERLVVVSNVALPSPSSCWGCGGPAAG